MPKISVIIPTYNQERYLDECIRSVLNQSFKDFEIVVVDDGSTDKTPEILRGYGGKIKYIRQKNMGAAEALNTAIKNSSGEYVSWLSSDDVFMPTKLEEQVSFFEKYPDIDVTYADFYIIDSNGKMKKEIFSPYYENKRDFIYNMVIGNFINGSSVMFKRRCLEKVGYFDREMKYHADGDMWFRMLKYFEFGHTPKTLLKYRWHHSNLSHNFIGMKRYLYKYYRKVFNLYSVDDIFSDNCDLYTVYFNLANILYEKHRLYSLAFSKLIYGIRNRPNCLFGYRLMVCFLAKLPIKFFDDLWLLMGSLKQKYAG